MNKENIKKYIRQTSNFITYLQEYIKHNSERLRRGLVVGEFATPLINSLEVIKIRLRKLEDWVDGVSE